MKIVLNFKLKINDEMIHHVNKIGKNINVEIDGKTLSMTSLKWGHEIYVICDQCNHNTKVKSLQPYIYKNKNFLCRKCRSSGERNGMYGKTHSEETKRAFSEKYLGKNNPFYGKKHTIKTKVVQSQRKIGMYDGENNPMYNKSVLNIWIEKYGYDKAMSMWDDKKRCQSLIMSGEKNPMFNKSVLDVWIKKYGYLIAEEKYRKWINNVSSGLKNFYFDNIEAKKNISEKLKGRVFTNEHRKNLRISTINYIEKRLQLNGGHHVPAFNINACNVFDKISNILKINIQHALNGGEYYIKELGYWVDGYDSDNNVVYEFYEKYHKYSQDRDFRRENEIKQHLNCEFIIIWECEENNFINKLIENEI